MTRLNFETACNHGEYGECGEPRVVAISPDRGYVTEFCAGGSSREVTEAELCKTHGAPETVSEEAGICWLYDGDKDCVLVTK